MYVLVFVSVYSLPIKRPVGFILPSFGN
jgi:hypothetical protein